METTLLTPVSTATQTADTINETSNSDISSDFETFLLMLTAQLENQDPLNPVESTDFATQLATFSGVEQQVKTNDLLADLGLQFGQIGLAQLAGWVGMEAKVAAPAYFDGSPMTLYPSTETSADDAALVVRNTAGQEVSRQQLPLGNQPIDWAGTDIYGDPLPVGTYGFTVESYANGQVIGTQIAETYALVAEASFSDGRTMMILQGGSQVAVADVSSIRAAGT